MAVSSSSIQDTSTLHLSHKDASKFYLFKSDGVEKIIEPTQASLSYADRIIELNHLASFNLGIDYLDNPEPYHLKALDSDEIPKLTSLSVAPVASEEFFAVKEKQDDINKILKRFAWPAVLNRNDLFLVDYTDDMPCSKTIYFYVRVMGMTDELNKPVGYGLFNRNECKMKLSAAPCSCRIPMINFDEGVVMLNPEIQHELVNAFKKRSNRELVSILLCGPHGFGKHSTLRRAAREAGLNVFFPQGRTREEYDQRVQDLAKFQPSCIVVDFGDFERVHRLLRRAALSDDLFLVTIFNETEVRSQKSFKYVFTFKGLNLNERQLFLSKAMPSELIQEAIEVTQGFSIADLIQLEKTVSLWNKMGKAMNLGAIAKTIRVCKSGLQSQIPKVTWDQVAGLSEAKHFIRETIELPVKHAGDLDPRLGHRIGVLLYGPPGSGKTLLAKALATEYQMCFMAVKGPELMSMYIGETESNIRELFAQARLNQPTIIFFDELDSLATARGQDGDSGGVTDRIVAQLLVEMDRLAEDPAGRVFIIGATNRPDLLDTALLRPGRLDKAIYLGAPSNKAEQLAVLQVSCKDMLLDPDVRLDQLALAPNYSPADLANVCRIAMRMALKRRVKVLEVNPDGDDLIVRVSQDDFVKASAMVKPSIANVVA